jgi:hypothetical protein
LTSPAGCNKMQVAEDLGGKLPQLDIAVLKAEDGAG